MPQNRMVQLGVGVGVIALLGVTALAVLIPDPTPTQGAVFRIDLALGAAGFSMALAGFVTVKLGTGKHLAISAGGALAVFVIVFFFNPRLVEADTQRVLSTSKEARLCRDNLTHLEFSVLAATDGDCGALAKAVTHANSACQGILERIKDATE